MVTSEAIHLYVPEDFLDLKHRGFLIPILRPFFKKEGYTDTQRVADYGLSERDFTRVDDLNRADVVVIPMAWEYYRQNGQTDKLERWIRSHEGKTPVWSWNAGDHGVTIPALPDHVSVFCLNAYASKKNKNERAMPAFFSDPLKDMPKSDLRAPSVSDITIGFCGQAKGNGLKYSFDVIRTIFRNVLFFAKLSLYRPHAIFSSTRLRNSLLKRIKKEPGITSDFIKRRKYRAGATSKEERERSRAEFLVNMFRNNYTVCVRGGGNFSVRLFETMALGRIPVQVDTDCLYPLPELINWKDQTCYVPYEKRNQIAAILKAYHASHNVEAVRNKNREIWSEYLTMKGFFKAEYQMVKDRNV